MSGILDGKVVIITGRRSRHRARLRARVRATRRQGRGERPRGTADGSGSGSGGPADDVVAEIDAPGGEAVANADDVAD